MRFGVGDRLAGSVRLGFHARHLDQPPRFGLTLEFLKEAGSLPVGKDIAIKIDAEVIRSL